MFVDLTHLGREKAKADAEFYKAHKQAEAHKVINRLLNLQWISLSSDLHFSLQFH